MNWFRTELQAHMTDDQIMHFEAILGGLQRELKEKGFMHRSEMAKRMCELLDANGQAHTNGIESFWALV